MLFNSIEFFVFFFISTTIYFVTPQRFKWIVLILASCIFYMALIPYYIIFVLATSINDYSVGLFIEKYENKKTLFLLQSIIINLGILFFFKYYNFFSINIEQISKLIGWNYSLPVLKLVLPIGLSFYIFKSLSYTIEVYRGNQKTEHHFGRYFLFVIFYPEILAGPIDRPQNLLSQFYDTHVFDYKRVTFGLKLIAWGLLKKVVIADRIAISVNHIYGHLHDYTGVPLMICAVFFAFQLYFDFSGYTDIAIGVGKVLGFNLPENFDKPYLSGSITEFWRRWHITLSNWLKDYLFTPIAIGTRNWGTFSLVFSLLVTFFLAGLWHGAGWTFIIFGSLHGVALVFELLTRKMRKRVSKRLPVIAYNSFAIIISFIYLCFAFVFFRSANLADALYFLSHSVKGIRFSLGGYNLGIGQFEVLLTIIFIVSYMCIEVFTKKNIIEAISEKPLATRWAIYYVIVMIIIVFGEFGATNFIYFKF